MSLRQAFCVTMIAAGLFAAGPAMAEYPERAITLVVPYPPGGSIDRVARDFGSYLSEKWKKPVIVENKAGGNGIIASEYVKNSDPDGYTIMVGGGSTHSVGAATDPEIKYDPFKDFCTIAYVGDTPLVVTAGSSVGNLDFAQMLEKSKSGKGYRYGSVGHSTFLTGELLRVQSGAKLRYVNYKQFGPTLIDLVRGDIDLGISSLAIVIGNIQQKMVRPLAVTSKERSSLLPDVPAVAEVYPDFEVLIWYALFGPASLPMEIRQKWHAEMTSYQADMPRAEKWKAEAFNLRSRTMTEFDDFFAADYEKWSKLAVESGVGRKK